MWEIKKINAQNIISFSDLNYDVEKGVATIIIGENRDDKSQKVNGSGKSAIIEAITIAFTGEPLRKVKTDEFISDWADEACVEMTLHNDYSNKDFIISRSFARKSPQTIECHIFDCETEQEVDTDKTVQSSVLEYNKFIMDELGISKDDLFNYYILSSKYESFFESSDRVKKELINRFSNGVLVDKGIEKLEDDLTVRDKEVVEANNTVFSINGSIESLTKEINQAAQKQEEAKKSKEEKIVEYKQYIANKRAEIREHNSQIDKANDRIETINEVKTKIEKLDADEKLSLADAYDKILDEFTENKLSGLSNIKSLSANLVAELKLANDQITTIDKKMKLADTLCQTAKTDVDDSDSKLKKSKEELDTQEKKLSKRESEFNKALDKYDEEFTELESKLKSKKEEKNDLQKSIVALENVLAGVISCPKCGHKFSLQSDRSVDDISDEVTEKKNLSEKLDDEMSQISKKNSEMTKAYNGIQDKLDDIYEQRNGFKKIIQECSDDRQSKVEAYNEAKNTLAKLGIELNTIKGRVQEYGTKIKSLRSNLFDDAYRIISTSVSNGETYVNNQKEYIKTLEGSIEVYENSIKTLEQASDSNIEESLKNSRDEYQKKLEVAEDEKAKAVERRDRLAEQKQLFLKYKAHLANKKLTAISQIVNKVLEEIGSNIRVDLQGYKVLRTGKLKESISVQLLKNGMECGSFYKFSAGERCRVNLASIIALQRLTNSNCDDGKGLDLLIFDEILDSSDQVGFESYCNTINNMGITSLLITQNSLPENYPYSLTVVKENDMSHILTD